MQLDASLLNHRLRNPPSRAVHASQHHDLGPFLTCTIRVEGLLLASHLGFIAPFAPTASMEEVPQGVDFIRYDHGLEEKYLPAMRSLITGGLSEPYSIYVYRYFLCQWGHLCFMVCSDPRPWRSDHA